MPLDANSARNLADHVGRQLDAVGVISSDEAIVVETFPDAVGEMRMVVHSPFGGRVNGAWALALADALRERTGVAVETQVNDDGILLRFPAAQADWSPLAGIVQAMTPAEARRRILAELPHSAVFGAHFRMNAARALLLPKARGAQAHPLLAPAAQGEGLARYRRPADENFPIVAETYRDCLRDVLDLEHLDRLLAAIQEGTIRVVPIETAVPSPVAAGLLYNFISVYMYEWDAPKAERQLQALALRRELVDDLLTGAASGQTPLKPEALAEVAGRAGHLAPGSAARSADELAVFLLELGDLTTGEVLARCAGDGLAWLAQLAAQGRILEIAIPTRPAPRRGGRRQNWPTNIGQWGKTRHGGTTPPRLSASSAATCAAPARSPAPRSWPATPSTSTGWMKPWPAWSPRGTSSRATSPRRPPRDRDSHGRTTAYDFSRILRPRLFEQLYRRTVALLRREVQPVSLAAYADFLSAGRALRVAGRSRAGCNVRRIMGQLRGLALPARRLGARRAARPA